MTINPEKAKLLMNKVQFVGYILDKEGIEFSEEKKEKALNLELPLTCKSLKSFMGIAEVFHKHIPNFMDKARPLHVMLRGYNDLNNKSKKLAWAEEDKKAFVELQKAIGNAQKLHFIDEKN